VTERGIGCDECEGRGYLISGQDNGVDNTTYTPCPNCSPDPDMPERDFTEDEEAAALAEAEAEAIW